MVSNESNLGVGPSGLVAAVGGGMSCWIGDPIATIMPSRALSPTAGAILLGVHAWGGNALYMKILAACTHPVPQEIDFTIATIVARQRRSHVD